MCVCVQLQRKEPKAGVYYQTGQSKAIQTPRCMKRSLQVYSSPNKPYLGGRRVAYSCRQHLLFGCWGPGVAAAIRAGIPLKQSRGFRDPAPFCLVLSCWPIWKQEDDWKLDIDAHWRKKRMTGNSNPTMISFVFPSGALGNMKETYTIWFPHLLCWWWQSFYVNPLQVRPFVSSSARRTQENTTQERYSSQKHLYSSLRA